MVLPLIMAAFGALVGAGSSSSRERTGLANDTVIGVFFAGAIGFGAMILYGFRDRRTFDPERFLFGGPILVQPHDLLILAVLFVLTALVFLLAVQPVRAGELQPEPGPVPAGPGGAQ